VGVARQAAGREIAKRAKEEVEREREGERERERCIYKLI